MTSSNILRWGGLVAILSGLLVIVVALFPPGGGEPTFPGITSARVMYWAVGLATMFALIAVYVVQVEETGTLGLVGFFLATIGNALFLAEDVAELAGGLMALGIVLLGIATWRAEKFSRWVPGLWLASVVIGMTGNILGGGGDLSHTLNMIAGVPFGLAFILAGYSLWATKVPTLAH